MTPNEARAARAVLGLTLADAASEIGKSVALMSLYERGLRRLDPLDAAKLRWFYESRGAAFHDDKLPTSKDKTAELLAQEFVGALTFVPIENRNTLRKALVKLIEGVRK